MAMLRFKKSIDFTQLETHEANKGFYVYFLIKDKIVVYVGRTEIHPGIRVYNHRDKEFDSYCFFELETMQESVEAEFWNIAEYTPKYNNTLDWLPNSVLNESTVKRIAKLEDNETRKLLRRVRPLFSLICNYYKTEDIAKTIGKSIGYCLTFKKI